MALDHTITSMLQRLRKTASNTHLRRPRRQAMLVEAMEPRILHSADASPALLGDFSAPQIEHRIVEPSGEVDPSAAHAEQRQALEIVFVDPATPDYQTLIDDIRANGQDGRHLEVVLLDGQRDGIAQISEYLAAHQDISAVHIISHGSDATVQLGLGVLDADTLSRNAVQIARWGDSLTPNADLLIYGCDVAATAEGRALMDALAGLTGADVAASTDNSGHAALGGNWDLEYRIGAIEAQLALGLEAQDEWFALLAAPSLAGANDLSAIAEDPASNPGTLVSALIAGQVSDPDAGALTGIAVTAVDNTNGTWQYSTNGGSNWNDFGTPGAASARLLAADGNSYVRFVPNADWNGTVTNGVTFRAWDQTSGVNGGTADTTIQVNTVRDNFGAISYGNNDGSASWSADWVDTDANPNGGNVQVAGGQLELRSNIGSDSIYREANLSGATGATLSFDYDNQLFLGIGGNIALEVSGDGGGSYTTLTNFSPGSNTGTGSYSADISAYVASNTRIRFSITGISLPTQTVFVDNLQISYSTPLNGGSTAFSAGTAASSITVAPVNDAPMGVPTISGTVTEDQILTADTSGISDADGLGAFSYQWLRDGVAIGGATASTYTLGDADVGTLISVQVSYTDVQGTAEGPLTSPQTAAVTNVNDAPMGVPTISGTVTEDQILTADTSGISDADGLGAFSYQWMRDAVAIAGATSNTYTLGGSDVGTQISVAVSYTDGNGTNEGPLTSVQTALVANVAPTAPSGPGPAILDIPVGAPVVAAPPLPDTGDSGGAPPATSDGNIDSSVPGAAAEDEASAEETANGTPADSTPAGRSSQNALLGSSSVQTTHSNRGSNVAYGRGDLRLLWGTPDLLEATLADFVLAPRDTPSATQTALAALQSTDLLNELDHLRDDLLEESRIEANTIALTTAATLGLSVGYVFWLLRGGVLLSTVLSSLPAWRFVDPLPILGRLADDDDEAGEPDESLESLVARKNRAPVDKKSEAVPA